MQLRLADTEKGMGHSQIQGLQRGTEFSFPPPLSSVFILVASSSVYALHIVAKWPWPFQALSYHLRGHS